MLRRSQKAFSDNERRAGGNEVSALLHTRASVTHVGSMMNFLLSKGQHQRRERRDSVLSLTQTKEKYMSEGMSRFVVKTCPRGALLPSHQADMYSSLGAKTACEKDLASGSKRLRKEGEI